MGTVALAYGSVPFYKMVSTYCSCPSISPMKDSTDLITWYRFASRLAGAVNPSKLISLAMVIQLHV